MYYNKFFQHIGVIFFIVIGVFLPVMIMGVDAQEIHETSIRKETITTNSAGSRTYDPHIKLQAPLPIGEEGTQIELSDSSYFYVYVVKVYRWIAGIAGALAILMVIAGGFQIALARGDSGMVDSGKERITGALIGLGLLFTSTTILRVINPNFYTFDADIVLNNELQMEEVILQGMSMHHSEDILSSAAYSAVITSVSGQKSTDPNWIDYSAESGNILQHSSSKDFSMDSYKSSRTIVKPRAIILHATLGRSVKEAVDHWRNNLKSGVFCNIILDRDGKAYQITRSIEERSACQSPFNSIGGISIEIVGMTKELTNPNHIAYSSPKNANLKSAYSKMTDYIINNQSQQVESLVKLLNWLTKKYNIPKDNDFNDQKGIFSHEQLMSTKSKESPGKWDPGEEYMKMIFQRIGGSYQCPSYVKSCSS